MGPLHEKDTASAVTGKLMWVHRVELDPMGRADSLVVKLHGDKRAVLVLVSPVPEGAGLWLVSSESGDVAVIGGQVHHLDTTGMGLEEGAHGCA